MVLLYADNMTLSDIGKIFNVSGVSVRYRLKQRGVYDKDRGKWTEEEKNRMIEMYEKGNILLVDIGKEFGIAAHSCSQLLKGWGVKRLGAQRALITNRNGVEESDIVRTYHELRDIEAVAKVYNTSDTSIRTILRRNGLDKVGLKAELNKLLEDNREYIHRRVAEGSGLITICKELGGINPTTLYNYAKKWGLKAEYPLVKKVRKILDDNREAMYRDYYEGRMSLGRLADKYDISPSRMGIEVAKWGWKLRWGAIDTSIERFVEKCLSDAGVRFEKQFKLGRYRCDFYLPDSNLILETNGDYWHGNPIRYKESEFDEIQRKNIKRDERKFKAAKNAGYSIAYIWESEIDDHPDKVQKILCSLMTIPRFHCSCRDFFLEHNCAA